MPTQPTQPRAPGPSSGSGRHPDADSGVGHSPPGTQAVDRALNLLWTIARAREISLSELATTAGLTPGTAARLARALVAAGLVRRNPVTDGFHLGPGSATLGRAAEQVLGLDKALPILEGLGHATSESVNLVVREGEESVVVMRVESTQALRFTQSVGARFPLYSTASGKAMLAFDPTAEEYLRSLPDKLPAVAPGTLATREQLREQLDDVRERGYSIDIEENVEGVRCVGAPVLDDGGISRAAVVLQCPAVRLDHTRILEIAPMVQATALEVASVLPTSPLLADPRRPTRPG